MKKKLECGDLIVVDPDTDPILLLVISEKEKFYLKPKPSWFVEDDSYFCVVVASNSKKNHILVGDIDWWDLSEETISFRFAQGRRYMHLKDFLERKKRIMEKKSHKNSQK